MKKVIGIVKEESRSEVLSVKKSLKIVRGFYKEIDRDLDDIEQIDNQTKRTAWRDFIEPGISLYSAIYMRNEDAFFIQEAAISKITKIDPDLNQHLLERQSNLHIPYRYSIRDGLLLIQFHVFLEGITEEHLKIRLQTFVPFCLREFESLSEIFEIKPIIRHGHDLFLK